MTHNTREVEEIAKQPWEHEMDLLWLDGAPTFKAQKNLIRFLIETHNHQLQKAREEEKIRAIEIIKDELRTAPLEVQMTKGIIFASIVGRIQTDPLPTQVTE